MIYALSYGENTCYYVKESFLCPAPRHGTWGRRGAEFLLSRLTFLSVAFMYSLSLTAGSGQASPRRSGLKPGLETGSPGARLALQA